MAKAGLLSLQLHEGRVHPSLDSKEALWQDKGVQDIVQEKSEKSQFGA